MPPCEVSATQVLGMVCGCTVRVDKGSVCDRVLCVSLSIHPVVCDHTVPSNACGFACTTFVRLPHLPGNMPTLVGLILPSLYPPRVPCGQPVCEAVHLPGSFPKNDLPPAPLLAMHLLCDVLGLSGIGVGSDCLSSKRFSRSAVPRRRDLHGTDLRKWLSLSREVTATNLRQKSCSDPRKACVHVRPAQMDGVYMPCASRNRLDPAGSSCKW